MLAWSLAAVALLAVVVFASSALSGLNAGSTRSVESLAETERARARDVDSARAALASGDTTAALLIAQSILEAAPDDARAQAVVAAVTAARAAAPSGAAAVDDAAVELQPEADDARYLSGVDDIAALLPQAFDGYHMGFAAGNATDVDVSATPDSPDRSAFRIAWAVHEAKDPADARDRVDRTVRTLYRKDEDDSVVVDGRSAYFGTDGAELAAVAFTRGRYIFEVTAVADKKGDAARLKPLVVDAARAFRD